MSIELLVGAVVVFAVVVYFVLKDKKDETIVETTLVADKVEAETTPVVKAAPVKKAAPKKTATKSAAPKKTATTGAKRGRKPKTSE